MCKSLRFQIFPDFFKKMEAHDFLNKGSGRWSTTSALILTWEAGLRSVHLRMLSPTLQGSKIKLPGPSWFWVMAVTPFRMKAEERAKLKKEEQDHCEPPTKRACTTYEKQLSKLPHGDLQTVKDIGSKKTSRARPSFFPQR